MDLESLVSTLLEEMHKLSRSETVVGAPIEVGDTRVVPVSELSLGFGAGSGTGRGKHDLSSQAKAEGGGAGGLVQVNPLGFIVVDPDGHAQLQSLRHQRSSALAKAIDLIPKLTDQVLAAAGEGDPKPAPELAEKK